MDIKDNERVLDSNHYRRVVEEYEKKLYEWFFKNTKTRSYKYGKKL